MDVKLTPLEGLLEIIPQTLPDERGWFVELHKRSAFSKQIPDLAVPMQENLSFSKKGVIRGLHMQLSPAQQGKLVMVLSGKALDVAVDLRQGSPSFGQAYATTLGGAPLRMLWIPPGFAHGFGSLEDTLLLYRCSSEYAPQYEAGLRWNDPELGIDWGIKNPIVSPKDSRLPTLRELIRQSIVLP